MKMKKKRIKIKKERGMDIIQDRIDNCEQEIKEISNCIEVDSSEFTQTCK